MTHKTSHSHSHDSGHSHSHGTTHHHDSSHSHSHGHGAGHAHGHSHAHHPAAVKKSATFSKVFRWKQEQPGPMPVKVEVAGTFSAWQKLPLKYDRANAIWQATVENIPGNKTHNYMLLVNGRPTACKNSDGLAIPHTEEEKSHALETPRGPRLFMLFSQTK